MNDFKVPSAGSDSGGGLRIAVLAVLLAVAWLLWSGFFKPLLLGLGALSCVLTIVVARRMGYFDRDIFAFNYGHRLFHFWGWLAIEIVKSSLDVAREVLRPNIDVHPVVVTLDAHDFKRVDQAVLGNSITLTPGTLTLDVHEDRLLVHALTANAAEALENGEMQRRVAALRRG